MAEHDAIFGAEASGHYFHKDFYYLDDPVLTLLRVMEVLEGSKAPLSQLVAPHDKYTMLGEDLPLSGDPQAAIRSLHDAFEHFEKEYFDGITITTPHSWANIRPSNTEPLLRVRVESAHPYAAQRMHSEIRYAVKDFVR